MHSPASQEFLCIRVQCYKPLPISNLVQPAPGYFVAPQQTSFKTRTNLSNRWLVLETLVKIPTKIPISCVEPNITPNLNWQKANERWTSPLPLAMTKYVSTRPCGVIWQQHRNLHVLRMYKCPVFQEAMVVTLKHVLKGGHKYSKNIIIPKVFTHKSGRKRANAEQVHIHFQWWR